MQHLGTCNTVDKVGNHQHLALYIIKTLKLLTDGRGERRGDMRGKE